MGTGRYEIDPFVRTEVSDHGLMTAACADVLTRGLHSKCDQ